MDFYLQVLADKTGSLVSTAASFGALLSGAGQLMADVVSDFGEKVGVAFQIADDVLDLASSGEQSGKTPGTDLREGVDTLPVLLLRRREAAGTIDEAGARILRELTGDLSSDGGAGVRSSSSCAATTSLRRRVSSRARGRTTRSPRWRRCPRARRRPRWRRSRTSWWIAWSDCR